MYFINDETHFRIIDREYVAFSGLSKETVVLHELAFDVLTSLKKCPYSFEKLLIILLKKNKGMTEKELRVFLRSTLESFCELGFVEGCEV